MTDQQPHTPTTEVIRETYIGEPPYALYGYTEEEFDRWLSTVEAAAEQRGKAEGWVKGVSDLNWHQQGYIDLTNPYRADREGDDE